MFLATQRVINLLKVIAERLRISMRQVDLVARLSGDEFVLVLKNLHEPVHAQIQAEKILQFIREPITLKTKTSPSTVRLALPIYPEDGGQRRWPIKSR